MAKYVQRAVLHLCYCYKRERSSTINDFIQRTRIEKAMALLHSGVENIGYVAQATGFSDSGYFSKKFKKGNRDVSQ